MGVDEFRSELATLKETFGEELIPNVEIFEKMCIDAQRRNLTNLVAVSTDHPPLSTKGLKRLMFPVCVTVSILGLVLFVIIGSLYGSLSNEISKAGSANRVHNSTMSSAVNTSDNSHSKTTSVPLSKSSKPPNSPSKSSNSKSSNNESNNNKNNSFEIINDSSNSTNSKSSPLYYISTGEGILSHFFQLQHLWSITHALNRSLAPVPFHSNHHPESEWINLCDIFNMPSDIECFGHGSQSVLNLTDPNNNPNSNLNTIPGQLINLTPEQVVKDHKCTLLGTYSWALDPRIYSLPRTQKAEKKFNFLLGDCVAGFVDDKSGFSDPNSTVSSNPNRVTFPKVKFTDKYVKLVRGAKKLLGLKNDDNYTVAHWLMNDNPSLKKETDCEKKKNEKKNEVKNEKINEKINEMNNTTDEKYTDKGCLTHHDFINQVQDGLKISFNDNLNNKLVYIVTIERDESILNDLNNAGFKLFSDLKLGKLSTLDKNVLELGLMTDSNYQLLRGGNNIKMFSELIHGQGLKQFRDGF